MSTPLDKTRPLTASDFPTVSRREADFQKALCAWLGPLNSRGGAVLDELCCALTNELETPVTWSNLRGQTGLCTAEVGREAAWNFRVVCTPGGGLAHQTLGGSLDLSLALAVVDTSVARAPHERQNIRPLSPWEQGILWAWCARVTAFLTSLGGPHFQLIPEHQRALVSANPPSVANPSEPNTEATWSAIAVDLSCAGQRGVLRLIWQETKATPPAPVAPRPKDSWWLRSGLTVPLRWELARLTLTAGDLAKLEPGSVVVGGTLATKPPLLWLSLGGRRAVSACPVSGALPDQHFVVQPSDDQQSSNLLDFEAVAKENTMSSQSTSPSLVDPAVLENAPVSVVVELGELSLPLARLASLQPGDILDLQAPLSGPVSLRMGNQLLARGELVALEGHLGVRILSA